MPFLSTEYIKNSTISYHWHSQVVNSCLLYLVWTISLLAVLPDCALCPFFEIQTRAICVALHLSQFISLSSACQSLHWLGLWKSCQDLPFADANFLNWAYRKITYLNCTFVNYVPVRLVLFCNQDFYMSEWLSHVFKVHLECSFPKIWKGL